MGKLLLTKDTNQAKQLSRLFKQKKVRRIYKGIYSDDLQAPIEEIVQNNWMDIVSHIAPRN